MLKKYDDLKEMPDKMHLLDLKTGWHGKYIMKYLLPG